ncbi:type VI secretion system protein TssL, long form [Rheinheimera baltica]|uniref:type VI secretion system protein TssL, long form n=1 Tax=Rheinheimera baltica TaxID=67576 RepID=UPI00273DE8DF|nr:type VI secretion system protein TssL, long form [Rheinheimera baltica]MDP5143315.1 type VI secretion system protein TssL, long form [Rheinheimera baltica]MDP5151149.1 type VI secretion system protein TssL, long form [Rheinheimera baltica]MDP5190407.1 type VI secretion system protein TssL, long form [Rheinheimera baltica]
MSDKTVMKPRPGGRLVGKQSAPAQAPEHTGDNDKTRMSANVRSAESSQKLQVLSISDNLLIDEAGALFSLVSPIRSTTQHADVPGLKTQCVQLINQYEQQLRYKNISSELIEKARYCMCSFIDEMVLNTLWGGNSDWATESLLSTFHNETFGGEYFFTLLDNAIASPQEHLLLLELQYLCLSFGFVGKMRIEERGFEKLEGFRERAFKAIRSQRGEPARELSPGWRSQVVAANQLEAEFPLWVICSVVAAALLGCYMYLNYQINSYSNDVHRKLNSLVVWQQDVPQPATAKAHQDAIRLQQLLQTEIRRDLLQVIELPDRVRIRVGLDQLFNSGSTGINEGFQPVAAKIARALEGTEGKILVSGYTDDLPIFTSKYPSNWHLSLARANAMADALAAGADLRGRLWPEGHGDANPIAPNDSAANRTLNRRVEIDLLQ